MAKFEIPIVVNINAKEIVDDMLERGDTIKMNVHAHWNYNERDHLFHCSECAMGMVRNIYSFCPWCGSQMVDELPERIIKISSFTPDKGEYFLKNVGEE